MYCVTHVLLMGKDVVVKHMNTSLDNNGSLLD